MSFVTVQQLRDDWWDNPDLTQEQVDALDRLGDSVLEDALESATSKYDWNTYFTLLDEVRGEATRRLLGSLRDKHKEGES